ncbi:hypothetical protein QCA50_014753 [Cerrena zonata]|uniref:Uncharacterized protein n=1 Tax=Cerrena zonata TaxID=2478898 RepID=A0AAW0FMS6_9APHY
MASTSTSMLRGRKRFFADIAATSQITDHDTGGPCVKDIRVGDDRESFICTIHDDGGQTITSLTFITVPEEYPHNHTFLCIIDDECQPPEYMREIANSVADYVSMTVDALLKRVLRSISSYTGNSDRKGFHNIDNSDDALYAGLEEEEDEDQSGSPFAPDLDLDLALPPTSSNFPTDWQVLGRDFTQVIAAGYQPGYTRLESKGIILSISIPIITLASQIEPRALMAWDSRLLSESQHLTLIIAGFHDVYPVLHHDGFLVPRLKDLGIKDLQFRVGLTPTYKADKDTLREILCRPDPVKVEEDDPQLVEDLRLAESLQCEEYSQLDFLDTPFSPLSPYNTVPIGGNMPVTCGSDGAARSCTYCRMTREDMPD